MAMRIPASMGFLSRKTKNKPVTVEEPHPIFEELERMEEAVPERWLRVRLRIKGPNAWPRARLRLKGLTAQPRVLSRTMGGAAGGGPVLDPPIVRATR